MAMAAANGAAMPPSATSGLEAIVCHSCKKAISGTSTYIKVGDVKFHSDCFTCCQCGISLHGMKFWHKKEKYYCQDDYEKLLPICKKCNQRISNGKMIGAMNAHYHPEHFTCSKCQIPLGTTFFNRDGQPYCQKCGGPPERCTHCGQEAKTDEIIRASGKPYHEHCLACYYCQRPLAKSGSTIFRKDDRLYCQQDYQELFAHRCTSCGDPILNDCIAVNAEFYHGKCFRCVQCAVHLDKYLSIGGELRCSNHISASSMRVVCNVCREPVPVHTVVAAVGAKFHVDCFRCSFCQKQLDKVSAKVRDKLICCQDCLVASSISPSLPIKEGGYNRQVEARVKNILLPLPVDPSVAPLSNSSDRHRSKLSDPEVLGGSSFTEAVPAQKTPSSPSAASVVKEKRRSSPRRPKGLTLSSSQSNETNVELKLEWKKGDMIGKGSFGKVYMGMLVTGELIAVKQIELTTMEDKARAAQLQTEINLMKKLKHPNIVALLGTEQEATKFNILMEYVPGKSIDFLLESFGPFQEATIRMYTAQLLSALEYMHRQDVIHRDIKGKNVLVDTFGNLKLADFGSAKQFENILAKEAPSIGYNYTPLWTAPEVLLGNYGRKVDVWSLGCVLIEMATAQSPWAECNFDNPFRALYHIGNSNAVPKIPSNLSEVAQDFIRQCLTRSPDDRPDAKDLMSHPFVAKSFNNAEVHSDEDDEQNSQRECSSD